MLVLLLLALATQACALVTTWDCYDTTVRNIAGNEAIVWTNTTCECHTPLWSAGPLHFNIVKVDLSAASVRPIPLVANASVPYQLQPLDEMASQNPNVVVGINGGYFFRDDVSNFIDNVCWGKTKKEAQEPPNPVVPNSGIGDSMVKVDGEFKGINCDKVGYSRPTALVLNGTYSFIEILSRGEQVNDTVATAIAAGPNLVSYNESTNSGFVNILKDDDNINIYEHAANTAVALSYGPHTTFLYLITVDGHDGGSVEQPTSGIDAHQLAYFLVDHLGVDQAMGMDQGGSTTMWVQGFGIVSNSDTTSPDASPRPLFDGLFIELVQ